MNKSTILLSILAWFVLTTFCYASPIKIEISLKNSANLLIATKITNISSIDQEVPVWLCSYEESWITSSPAIVILWPQTCAKNFIEMILLKPGESYSRNLSVAASSKAKAGSLTFQMGFYLKNNERFVVPLDGSNKEILKDIIWSNPITIEVNNAMLNDALRYERFLENLKQGTVIK